jgi:pentatricopeptide repeat protein
LARDVVEQMRLQGQARGVRVHHFVPSSDSRRRRARLQLLPSQGVYNAAIAAAAHAKRLQDIMFFLGEMKLRGMTPDARCFNIAISAICRAGHTAGLRTGHYDAALQLLADMRAAGVTPNLWTYTALLTACAAHGRLDDAHRMLASLRKDGLQMDGFCYAALIETHVTAGRADMGFLDAPPIEDQKPMTVLERCKLIAHEAYTAMRADTQTDPLVLHQAGSAVTCSLLGAYVWAKDYTGALKMVQERNKDPLTLYSAGCYRFAVSATLRAAAGAALNARNEMVPLNFGSPGEDDGTANRVTAALDALQAALALCDEAVSRGVITHLDTRREMLMFAASLASHAPAQAACEKLISLQFANGGFLQLSDTTTLIIQLLQLEPEPEAVRLALLLWQNLRLGTGAHNPTSPRVARALLRHLHKVENDPLCAGAVAAARTALAKFGDNEGHE